MVVQHNLTAMNSNRMLGVTVGAQAKSSEKLSSGYKINRAADDAAGLSISEKMRRQIRGLTQASANAEDGISAVQTAEGALTEVHDMLQRMNELANKAANGTMSSADRQDVQNEIDQLTTEIDRVAETTKFNETYLLKGDNTASKTDYQDFKDAGFGRYFKATDNATSPFTKLDIQYTAASSGDKITIKGTEYKVVDDITKVGFQSDEVDKAKANNILSVGEAGKMMLDEINKANKVGGVTWTDISKTADNLKTSGKISDTNGQAKGTLTTSKDLGLSLHVGADADFENKISMNIRRMDSNALGVKGISVTGSDPAAATYAIDNIEAAIKTVSAQRSELGAIQNRLEHTIKNVDNVIENTTAAESAIRDTDMATEMVKYSNNNILMQAGQSMLAQANQSNQGVLSLLG